jgi:aldehyde:ferredoxin oxidoreductase
MEWGSEKAVIAVIEKTVKQEGFGKILKDGIVPAANAIGGDAMDWAIQYRNMNPFPGAAALKASLGAWYVAPASQELWMHPPSADKDGVWPMIMEYDDKTEEEAKAMVDDWASENSERYTGDKDAWREDNYEKNAEYCVAMENVISICDMTGHCDYPSDRGPHCGWRWGQWEAAEAITAVTGVDCSPEMLVEAVQRRRAVELAYYHLCKKAGGQEEITSQRLFEVLVNRDGHYAGQAPDFEKLPIVTENYYKIRGCDPDTGIPTRKDLEELGLKDVADRLEEYGLEVIDFNEPEPDQTEADQTEPDQTETVQKNSAKVA